MTIQYRRDLWQLLDVSCLSGPAAEIGVAEGNFSHDILSFPNNTISLLYMVDRWACNPGQKGDGGFKQEWHDINLQSAIHKTDRFKDKRIVLRGESSAMAINVPDESLALLYIDGDHSYEGVMKDLQAWIPKVMSGGFVALHDFLNPAYGVSRAVEDFCSNLRGEDYDPTALIDIPFSPNLIPEDKPEDAGAWFQVC